MKRNKMYGLLAALLWLLPGTSLAEEAQSAFHLDGAAFVDSLQYMLKGMVGIFLVTGLIILALVILEHATKGGKE